MVLSGAASRKPIFSCVNLRFGIRVHSLPKVKKIKNYSEKDGSLKIFYDFEDSTVAVVGNEVIQEFHILVLTL